MPVCALEGKKKTKQQHCLFQTLDNKKGQSFCLFTLCFVFPASNMGSIVQTRVTCFPPTRPDRLKVKSSQNSPPTKTGNLMPVPESCLPGSQRLKQVSGGFKVGSGPRAAALRAVFISCFFSLMLMTVKPQRPPARIRRVLTQPLFTQAHNKSTTFLGAGDKSAARWRDNGERISRGLFRFSLVARLDNTSAWTKGATTGCFLKVCGVFLPYFGFWFSGKSLNTSCLLNNPLSSRLSPITNYIFHPTDREIWAGSQ